MEATPKQILIIEDDPVASDQYTRMLRLSGYDVRTVPSAELGLEEVQSRPPNAIIVDFGLPRMDGLGFLRLLRARADSRTTPVAIVTGDYFLDDAIPTELQELHAVVVFKPLWIEDLTSLVERLLNPL